MDTTAKKFEELTAYEQSLVSQAIGWDGEAYHDKDGLTITLVADGYVVTKPEGIAQTETTEEATTETTTDTTEVKTEEVTPEVKTEETTSANADSTAEVYTGPMGKYRITGLAETTDEDGNVTGSLEVGQVYELPETVGNDLVTKGVAELAAE